MTLPDVREHGGVMDGRDEAELIRDAVDSLRSRLPELSDVELRAIVVEELTCVRLSLFLEEHSEEGVPKEDAEG